MNEIENSKLTEGVDFKVCEVQVNVNFVERHDETDYNAVNDQILCQYNFSKLNSCSMYSGS